MRSHEASRSRFSYCSTYGLKSYLWSKIQTKYWKKWSKLFLVSSYDNLTPLEFFQKKLRAIAIFQQYKSLLDIEWVLIFIELLVPWNWIKPHGKIVYMLLIISVCLTNKVILVLKYSLRQDQTFKLAISYFEFLENENVVKNSWIFACDHYLISQYCDKNFSPFRKIVNAYCVVTGGFTGRIMDYSGSVRFQENIKQILKVWICNLEPSYTSNTY